MYRRVLNPKCVSFNSVVNVEHLLHEYSVEKYRERGVHTSSYNLYELNMNFPEPQNTGYAA
jgi:hypothetical protein